MRRGPARWASAPRRISIGKPPTPATTPASDGCEPSTSTWSTVRCGDCSRRSRSAGITMPTLTSPERSSAASSRSLSTSTETCTTCVAPSCAISSRDIDVRAESYTAASRSRTSKLIAKPNSRICITGMPTIMPKVSRSRRNWRVSLTATAQSLAIERFIEGQTLRATWRRRTRLPVMPGSVRSARQRPGR